MKFCDKLAKLRKQNNITQEQLADKLGLSRQAVSKWELGVSIPDMEKILELCNILNCTLEDLLDDGVINETKSTSTKINFTNYFQDFLKYITNIYNMFYSMKFKQKLKCLIEMAFIFLALLLILLIVYQVLDNIVLDNLFFIPKLGNCLYLFLRNTLVIALIILGLIVFFHLFKIRYLDYYITIEDKNSLEKTIEKPIEITEKPKKEYLEAKRKEKIIIRDPKHSTFSFFEFLSKILLFILKIFDFFILIFIVIAFIISLITFFFFMWHLKYGIIFFYIMLTILGLILITYVFFELFYNFLISKKQHFKRVFILILISFIVFSLGISSTTVAFFNLENTQQFNYLTETFTIEMQDNLVLLDDNYFNMNVEYVFDENEKDIKINLNYPEYINLYLNNYQENNYFIYLFHFNADFFKTYNLILNHLKEGKILNFNNLENYNLKIAISSENYQKLITNKENHLYSFSFN